ncbi:hypothetical protein J437_LFUL015810 [Ladona fulva]|uniref:Ion transport domain-containing protein n=1 Tax=Ladona fulva TaxID=123851 RepID=A0A8K0KJR4_LADFU|nr:hypothetical protein J437_LFUL015810 [Ladona fulva]
MSYGRMDFTMAELSHERITDTFILRPITEEMESEVLPNDSLYALDSVQDDNLNLFIAAVGSDPTGALRALKDGAHANAKSRIMRISALHVCASHGDEKTLQILLSAGADPNAADKLGRTPLHLAASAGSEVCVQKLLEAGAVPNVFYHVNTLMFKKTKPTPEKDPVPSVTLENLGLNIIRENVYHAVHCRFQAERYIECKFNNYNVNYVPFQLPSPECWGRTPLHQAVRANSPRCARALLERGARVDPKDERGSTPLMLAGEGFIFKEEQDMNNYEELVDALLEYGADPNLTNEGSGWTPLHRAVYLYSTKTTKLLLKHGADPGICSASSGHRTSLHLAATRAASSIIEAILDSELDESARQRLVNKPDINGHTALHLAANVGSQYCVSLLMEAGGDLGATTNHGLSALDEVLLYVPRPAQCLARIFDSRIRPTSSATVEEKTFAVLLDFCPLAPHGTSNQTGVMKALLEAGAATDDIRRLLLSHPLVEAFIVLKWRRLRLFFYFLVAAYVSFAISLSAYTTLIYCDIELSKFVLQGIEISRKVLLFSTTVVLLNVLGQCAALPKYYLKQFEMWVNLITAIASIVIAAYSGFDVNTEETETRIRGIESLNENYNWLVHVTSYTILLSWAELMLLIGRFPTWGSHALLFYAVFKNVLKVLLAFSCLILGFSLSFFVQFRKQEPESFGDPWKAFVRTIVMMMGEFEYLDLFKKDGKDSVSYLHITSRVIFLGFVVLASIVLVNLMVGLAVSDTQALRSEGEARRLLKQAEFVAHLERGVSAVISTKWLPQCLIDGLHRRRAIPPRVTVRPSDSAVAPAHNAGHHLPRRLLDDLVTIALSKRTEERTPIGYPEKELYRSDDLLPRNFHLTQVLENISRDISEIKELLDARNYAPSALRTRKWSSTIVPSRRFSDLVQEVTGAKKIMKNLNLTGKD